VVVCLLNFNLGAFKIFLDEDDADIMSAFCCHVYSVQLWLHVLLSALQ